MFPDDPARTRWLSAPSSRASDSGGWMMPAVLAATVPFLVSINAPPTSTFFNQWFAVLGAALWLLGWGLRRDAGDARGIGPAARGGVVLLLVLAVSQLVTSAPMGQRIIPAAELVLAALLTQAAASTVRQGRAEVFVQPLAAALVAAGLVSTVIGMVQVFAPHLAGGFIAYPSVGGRAVGNMRQPNQLATLLMWAMAAVVWLGVLRRWAVGTVAVLLAVLMVGVLWTSSRTGLVGIGLFALWGLVDRRLPGRVRLVMLVGVPLLYAAGWWGMEQWSASTGHFFYGDDQVKKTLHGDASSSRGKIWANTLAMIAAHPWTGVGPGAYNFVWSLTPFPDRPVAFFDHSHNAVLQLAVECGVPFAAGVLLLLAWALWRARGGLLQADGSRAAGVRTAWFMLTVVGVHSLLEYPLWYAYFLLPTAVVLGWACSGVVDATAHESPPVPRRWPRRLASSGGALMLAGALWALAQYYTVAIVFEPRLAFGEPALLPERIARGQRSVLFGHHADYADVTMAEHPEQVFASFERPMFHLLDTRLMTAYARALAARGELDKARAVAARLHEFRNPAADEFFAPCKAPAAQPQPFQCEADTRLPAAVLRPSAVMAARP